MLKVLLKCAKQVKKTNGILNWAISYDLARRLYHPCTILKIKDAYDNNSELQNLLLDPYFKGIVTEYQDALRDVVATGVRNGVPTPGFSASINYYDSYRSENLPANLIQAQRDYFGAHTYERKDKEGVFHTQWVEE